MHVDGFNTENGGNHFSGQFKTNINFIEVFARISYICIISIVPQLLSDVCIFIYIYQLYSGLDIQIARTRETTLERKTQQGSFWVELP